MLRATVAHSGVRYSVKQTNMEQKSYVSRVNQLDADLLDREIGKLFQEQLGSVYKELPPGIFAKYQPEIDCLLKSIIWLSSIQKNKSTFGQQVLAISYSPERLSRNKLILHYLLTVGSGYAKDVSEQRFTSHLSLQRLVTWIEACVKILTVLNFFRFLKIGVYPTLVDYVLRWNHVSESGTRRRNVGYAYMNRELIWSGLLDLLTVTLPLINFHALKRRVNGILKPKSPEVPHQNPQQPEININTTCGICNQRPSLPHHINCKHVFCYFCLKANVLADPTFQCPICDVPCTGDIFRVKMN